MSSLFISALLVLAAPEAAAGEAGPAPLDLQCYRLMALLAEDEDPRVGAVAMTGAQYFLGRIDASAPGFDPGTTPADAPASDAEPGRLLGLCGDAMGADGRDFHAIGERLARPRQTI